MKYVEDAVIYKSREVRREIRRETRKQEERKQDERKQEQNIGIRPLRKEKGRKEMFSYDKINF